MNEKLIEHCIDSAETINEMLGGAVGAAWVIKLHDAMLAAYDRLSDEEKMKVPKAIRAGMIYLPPRANATGPQEMNFLPPDPQEREAADRANAAGFATGFYSIGSMKEELARIADFPGLRFDFRFESVLKTVLHTSSPGAGELIVLRYACPTCRESACSAQEIRDFCENCRDEKEIWRRLCDFAREGLAAAIKMHAERRPDCGGKMDCKAAANSLGVCVQGRSLDAECAGCGQSYQPLGPYDRVCEGCRQRDRAAGESKAAQPHPDSWRDRSSLL